MENRKWVQIAGSDQGVVLLDSEGTVYAIGNGEVMRLPSPDEADDMEGKTRVMAWWNKRMAEKS